MALLAGHVTTDLHVAAKWRNEPNRHPNIIALATGRYPGVSTLAHFPQGNARTLAARLLEWAQTEPAGLATTPAQKRLLAALAETQVLGAYGSVVGDKVDAPYSILSDLVDLEIFVDRASDAQHFNEFFAGVTVVDLASLGIGDKERNMLLVLFLNLYYEYMINLVPRRRGRLAQDPPALERRVRGVQPTDRQPMGLRISPQRLPLFTAHPQMVESELPALRELRLRASNRLRHR